MSSKLIHDAWLEISIWHQNLLIILYSDFNRWHKDLEKITNLFYFSDRFLCVPNYKWKRWNFKKSKKITQLCFLCIYISPYTQQYAQVRAVWMYFSVNNIALLAPLSVAWYVYRAFTCCWLFINTFKFEIIWQCRSTIIHVGAMWQKKTNVQTINQ